MRYIGNKINLLEFIEKPLKENKIKQGTFCDIFSGTTNVAKHFKKLGFKIISNDNMMYSHVFQKAYIENNKTPKFKKLDKIIPDSNAENVFAYLNNLKGKKGFIYKNFCKEGSKNSTYTRNYFSKQNAQRIDAMREKLEIWKEKKLLTKNEYYIILCAILEEIPFVSNISGTYGAFLKIDDPRMSKKFTIKIPEFIQSKKIHKCYNTDSNQLLRKIKCDVLYIDPPYNHRQYAPNYHMWETVAVWDKKLLDSLTGLRPYENQKSLYCMKQKCLTAFEDLIENATCKHILFSYNSEGIMSDSQIKKVLSKRGKVKRYTKNYRRFKSNSKAKKPKKEIKEFVYYVKVD